MTGRVVADPAVERPDGRSSARPVSAREAPSRTIGAMQPVPEDAIVARRELVLAGALLVVLARAVEGTAAWPVVGLVLVAMLLAAAGVAGVERGLPALHAGVVPAVLVAGAAAAVRLVPVGLWLVVAVAVVAVILDRTVRLELRLLHQPAGPSPGDRSRVLLAAVVAGFVAFAGVAALVPGGLVEPVVDGAPPGPLSEPWLAALVAGDALAAALLGYRLASFRYASIRTVALSALTYATVIAIAAAAARAIDLPRLVGPALLALLLYLWDAVHGTSPARRREPRFVWEVLLLAVLGAVVVAWNLQLRG